MWILVGSLTCKSKTLSIPSDFTGFIRFCMTLKQQIIPVFTNYLKEWEREIIDIILIPKPDKDNKRKKSCKLVLQI